MKNDLINALDDGSAPWKEIEFRSKDYWVFKDAFPVTEGHLLFVPTTLEPGCLWPCFKAAYKFGYEGRWDGFNIGQNVGEAAGQTVMFPHIHMIPRRKGDMDDPRGGVRHVIPSQGNYKSKA